MISSRSLLILSVTFITASCAGPIKWRNPDVPHRQWAVDRATCESKAKLELDRERVAENMVRPDDEANSANSYEKNMSIYTDRKRLSLISGNCLKKLGYETVPRK